MSAGWKLITIYFAVTYWLPMIGNLMFADRFTSDYQVYPLTSYCVLSLMGVYTLFLVLELSKVRLLPSHDRSFVRTWVKWIGVTYLRFRLPFAVLAIVVGTLGLAARWNTYRYSDEGISQVLSVSLLGFILIPTIITADFVYCIFARPWETIRVGSRRYLENLLLALALVISTNGTASMLQASLVGLYSLFPGWFKRSVFSPSRKALLRGSIKTLVYALVVTLFLAFAWVVGETIKAASGGWAAAGAVQELESIGGDPHPAERYLLYLLERQSVYYYSFLFTAEAAPATLRQGAMSPLSFPLKTLYFRFDRLLGGVLRARKPSTSSLAHLNYQLLIYGPITDREGSSPGLLGSFNYVFGFPWNIMMCAAFLRVLATIVNRIARRQYPATISVFGTLVLLLFTHSVFQSPFDLLLLLDDNAFYVVLLWGIYLQSGQTRSHGQGQRRVARCEDAAYSVAQPPGLYGVSYSN